MTDMRRTTRSMNLGISLAALCSAPQKKMKSPSLEEKTEFFDQLDALDYLSDGDDEVDDGEKEHREQCRAFFTSRKKTNTAPVQEPAPIHSRRTRSMATPSAARASGVIEATPSALYPTTRQATGGASFIEETPVPDSTRPLPATLRRSATLPLPAASSAGEQSPSATTALRKRKRQSTAKALPESAQIFRGLAFYYIPNNDIAPARRLRIGRAQQYGARWVRNVADATHVIVDRHLEYKDIEGVVGPDVAASVVIVNEEYPIDCTSFRTLLNPDQLRYRVAGRPAGTNSPSGGALPVASQTSNRSLQVKLSRPSKRRDSEVTPPRDELVSQGLANQTSLDLPGEPTEAAAPAATSPRQQSDPRDRIPPAPRGPSTPDELSECIEFLQQYKDLPLDPEDDGDQSDKDAPEAASDSEMGEGSDDGRTSKRLAKTRGGGRKEISFEERFACNRGGTIDKAADAANPNAKTIEVLQRMCDYYMRINDHWRTTAYRRAIATLRRQAVKITSEEEAYRLPSIGHRLAAKIEEIACTSKLRRLDYANDEPLDRVLQTFLNIYGVGLGRANKWIAQGFRTLDDLRQRARLTPNQRIGVDRYADLNTRIPRAEVTALFAHVRREAARLDPAVELLVGGSYRRGADSSGDMDVIITKKGTTSSADLVPFLEQLVAALTRTGFIVATLAGLHHRRSGKDGPGSKWHGCCVLPTGADPVADENEPGRANDSNATNQNEQQNNTPRDPIWRRIDFLLVPESEYGAALIYFTGNDIFNRSMRLLASKKGMRLNQRGLYREVLRGRNRARITEGELVEGRDERRIFELLGVTWREPWERWC